MEEEEDDEGEDAEGEDEESTEPGPACLAQLIDSAHTIEADWWRRVGRRSVVRAKYPLMNHE